MKEGHTLPGMTADRFPSTHATWIDAQLTIAEGGDRAAAAGDASGGARAESARDALRRHVMERYASALTAYVSAPGLRRAGERDELVSGFFARTMSDPGFFLRWKSSGMPLRRWLMNAMAFHCRGVVRDRQREDGRTAIVDAAALAESLAGADNDDRLALVLVRVIERVLHARQSIARHTETTGITLQPDTENDILGQHLTSILQLEMEIALGATDTYDFRAVANIDLVLIKANGPLAENFFASARLESHRTA